MDFVDDGYTGSNFDRPGFQQMMDGVRNGKIDTIIVKDLSRFGRDYIGVGEYMEQIFPLLGVRLIAINDNYDSNNYKGTTLGMDVVVSNLVNTMYCRDAGKKLRTANQVKWRKGITTASAAPFGYQFDPDKKGAFIIDPPAAKIVRRIFDLAILGFPLKGKVRCGNCRRVMAHNFKQAVPTFWCREGFQKCIDDGGSNIPPDRETDKDGVILVHVIAFGGDGRARVRIAHFDGAAGFLVHPV